MPLNRHIRFQYQDAGDNNGNDKERDTGGFEAATGRS